MVALGGALYWSDASSEDHLYWTPGMPGVVSGALAALFLTGCLLLTRRFSLRSLVVAVVLTALAGTLGHWRSLEAVQEVPFWFPPPSEREAEVTVMLNEGLVGTLVQRGDLPASPTVIEVARGRGERHFGQMVLHLRPHNDRRVRGLAVAFSAYVQAEIELTAWPTDDPDRRLYAAEAAATWHNAVRERFGAEAAEAVAKASAKISQDADVRQAFEHIQDPAYPSWDHIRFTDP